MNRKLVAVSLAALGASIAVHAAAQSAKGLSVDITAPTKGSTTASPIWR